MEIIPGGIVAPQGFQTAGVYCGIKRKRKDLCLIVSDVEAAAAGVFTTNQVQAPCVIATRPICRTGSRAQSWSMRAMPTPATASRA